MKRVLKSAKGQVAIFVALVFQVLFVFFAMVINVGLLVHHKINLQNSVDLAAYYGAMKQAESLNAIAHINYQIRQSWKLLVFRYRHVGMSGIDDQTQGAGNNAPYDTTTKKILNEQDTKWDIKPAFCGMYYPFMPMHDKENYCKEIPATSYNIPFPGKPTFINTPFFNFVTGPLIELADKLQHAAKIGCETVGETNWYLIARQLYAYRRDVANRKKVLYAIANAMSLDSGDMIDLDGQSVREGIYKTLTKNFTSANKEGFLQKYDAANTKNASLKVINSLAMCGHGSDNTPPGWLKEIHVFPVLNYIDTECSNEKTTFENRSLNLAAGGPRYQKIYNSQIPELLPYVQEAAGNSDMENLYKTTVGFEKNPWCMAYMGVEASTTPKIPFSPAGSITLTAKAFAKPFGGKIGPWYESKWPVGSDKSSGGVKIDELLPPRSDKGEIPNDLNDPTLRPDFARYVGDQNGTASYLTASQTDKAIHENGEIPYDLWDQLVDKNEDVDDPSSNGDILAWDSQKDESPKIRDQEISFISPDQFDITYYSTEPDFYRNYAQRIQAGMKSGGRLKVPVAIRGDLGFRAKAKDQKLKVWGIRDQIDVAKDEKRNPYDILNKLEYYVKDGANLLTSWQGTNPEDFSLDITRFGKCLNQDAQLNSLKAKNVYDPVADGKGIVGNCVIGGRTGYSVKLVSEESLKGEQTNIGGAGVSGQIKNPPQ